MSGRYADAGEDSNVVRRFLLRQREAAGMTDRRSDALLNDIVKNSLAAEHFDCELRTLSDVIAEHRIERIDLLKVDVEKSELDVLEGIRAEDWPKISRSWWRYTMAPTSWRWSAGCCGDTAFRSSWSRMTNCAIRMCTWFTQSARWLVTARMSALRVRLTT
jgi:hypothetical protein